MPELRVLELELSLTAALRSVQFLQTVALKVKLAFG